MGYSALSHGIIPGLYGASHHCVRQGRVVGVKLKSKRSYGDLKLDVKQWEAPIPEWYAHFKPSSFSFFLAIVDSWFVKFYVWPAWKDSGMRGGWLWTK